MKTKYGIISDIHEDPRVAAPAIQVLKDQGIDKLILNGDIGNSQQFVANVLNSAGQSGIETYVQPGSHEKLEDFEPVIKHFQDKYSNLINVFDNQKISNKGQDLVFIPGSDFLCGGEYSLRDAGEAQSGFYKFNNGTMRIINMNDLTKLVTNPDKTIVVSHIPRKFDNLENGIDMAEFGEAEKRFQVNNDIFEEGIIMSRPVALGYVNAGCPIKFKKENRGNEDLKNIYEGLGIKKSVSGHFHESVHRACDRQGNKVNQGREIDELFWNASYCDNGKVGILSVNGDTNQVSYENLDLRDFIK